MSRTVLADAVVAELRKLGPGEKGDPKALKAAIGCTAAELKAAIYRLRYSGKIGFTGLALSPNMRADPAPPGPDARMRDAATDRPALEPAADRQTTATGDGSSSIPGESGSATGSPDRADGAKRTLSPPISAMNETACPECGEELCCCGAVDDENSAFNQAGIAMADQYHPPAGRRRRGRRWRIALPEGMRPTVEAIQSALAETPEEAMAAVRRRHPDLWRRAVALGRALGVTPASAFYDALDRGLSAIEAEGAGGLTHVERPFDFAQDREAASA